jgi:hypothetical protein
LTHCFHKNSYAINTFSSQAYFPFINAAYFFKSIPIFEKTVGILLVAHRMWNRSYFQKVTLVLLTFLGMHALRVRHRANIWINSNKKFHRQRQMIRTGNYDSLPQIHFKITGFMFFWSLHTWIISLHSSRTYGSTWTRYLSWWLIRC